MSLAVTLTLENMSLVYLGRYVLGRDLDLDLGTYVLGTYVLGIPWGYVLVRDLDLDLGTYVLGIPWELCPWS
jgi:hypothetical protein